MRNCQTSLKFGKFCSSNPILSNNGKAAYLEYDYRSAISLIDIFFMFHIVSHIMAILAHIKDDGRCRKCIKQP